MSPANKKVQGLHSDIGDLKLRSGKKFHKIVIELGGGITPTPSLTRTIEGASTLTVPVYDPNLSLLRHSLLSQKFDAGLDGLHFRYLGLNKTGKNLTLTLEDRDVAKLREFTGPARAFREEVTRAEFVKSLVREANPSLDFFCPQLHVKQPIEKKSQGKKAKDEADANRGKGLGATRGLTVKGAKATPQQIEVGERILRVCESLDCTFVVSAAVIAAAITESEFDLGAVGAEGAEGFLQLLPSTAASHHVDPKDVEAVTAEFLKNGYYLYGGAIVYSRRNPSANIGEIAQAVQGSATEDGSNYQANATEARKWVEAFHGGEGVGAATTTTEPFEFKVAKTETYWTAIQRLAKEVNWRAFVVAGRFFFIDEIELIRGQVRLAIDLDTEGVEDVDFDYNANKQTTEATVPVRVSKWGVPPGAVVTVEDFGPASIGSGDAPPKDPKAPHVASAVKASTHEGRGRYLVTSIEVPVGGDAETRLATITLKRPTKPLPEPANTTKTVGGTDTTPAGASVGGMGVLSGTAEDVVNQVIDYAHANGFPAVTRESVRAANAEHGPTSSGGRSDHQGPPDTAWAADISNGTETAEETHLAAAIAKAFGIPWDGSGLITHESGGYRMQLIYKAPEHYDHVHFGCEVS